MACVLALTVDAAERGVTPLAVYSTTATCFSVDEGDHQVITALYEPDRHAVGVHVSIGGATATTHYITLDSDMHKDLRWANCIRGAEAICIRAQRGGDGPRGPSPAAPRTSWATYGLAEPIQNRSTAALGGN